MKTARMLDTASGCLFVCLGEGENREKRKRNELLFFLKKFGIDIDWIARFLRVSDSFLAFVISSSYVYMYMPFFHPRLYLAGVGVSIKDCLAVFL